MTLLGSWLTANRAYAIADGRAVRPGPNGQSSSFETDKFNKSPHHPLSWGVINDPSPGAWFSQWLEAQDTLGEDWPSLAAQIRAEWMAIRGREMADLRKGWAIEARERWPPELETPNNELVVIGYIGEHPGAVATGIHGTTVLDQPGVEFFGPWRNHAWGAWAVMERLDMGADLGSESVLRDLLEPLCEHLNHLYLPLNIWEMSPDGRWKKL